MSDLDQTLIQIPRLAKVLPVQSEAAQRKGREVKQIVYDQIWNELPNIVQAMIDAAKGLHTEELDPFSGEIRRYQEKPNIVSGKFLVERVMGATPKLTTTDDQAEDFESMVKRLVRAKAALKAADRIVNVLEDQPTGGAGAPSPAEYKKRIAISG